MCSRAMAYPAINVRGIFRLQVPARVGMVYEETGEQMTNDQFSMTNDGGAPIAPRPCRAVQWAQRRAVKGLHRNTIRTWALRFRHSPRSFAKMFENNPS